MLTHPPCRSPLQRRLARAVEDQGIADLSRRVCGAGVLAEMRRKSRAASRELFQADVGRYARMRDADRSSLIPFGLEREYVFGLRSWRLPSPLQWITA